MTFDDRDKPAGQIVRRMLRTNRTATLSTIDAETGGAPYGSLVLAACAHDASPLLLMSDLARHSRNLAADVRASLLFAKSGTEAVGQARATVMGRIVADDDPLLRHRFMRRHATARDHMAFGDFRLYRMTVESVHFIGGFGRIETLAASDVLFAGVNPELAAAEADIVAHMNADHRDALCLYAHHFADRPGMNWQMTGIDPEGCELTRHDAEARIDFAEPVTDADGARAVFVRMAREARAEPADA
jgi:putative heme iron utilization protein